MGKKFNHLNIPSHWEHYWTKYPEGYTILEALLNWVGQVDNMVDNVNEWNEYLDGFAATFDKNLQGKVVSILSEWQGSGFLDVVIDEALQTQMDVLEQETHEKLNQFSSELAQIEYKLYPSGGDDFSHLQNAVDTYGVVEICGDLTLGASVRITKPVKLYSKHNHRLILTDTVKRFLQVEHDGVTVEGLSFDCSNKANVAIYVRNGLNNVTINNNTISNCLQIDSTTQTSGIQVGVENSVNITITNNNIENITGVGDGIENNTQGVSRGIYLWADVGYAENIRVENNHIENISPYEDGDGIAFVSANNDFKISLFIVNNKIVNAKKRGIKINPCHGIIIIEKNEVIQTDLENRMYAGISVYAKNALIRDNVLNVRYSWFGVDIEPTTSSYFEITNNIINGYRGSRIDDKQTRCIGLNGVLEYVLIRENHLDGTHGSIFVNKDINTLEVINNTFTNPYYSNVFVLADSSGTNEITNLIFSMNKISGNTGVYFSQVNELTIENLQCLSNVGTTVWGSVVDLTDSVTFVNTQIMNNPSQNQVNTDITFSSPTRGVVLIDRTTGTRYRLKIDNGEIGVDAL